MVCSHSFVGVAPGEAAQSRGDGVGSGSSRRRPSRQRLKPGWSQPVAEEGLPGRQVLLVKLPSGGFGLYNAKIGPPYSFWTSLHSGGLGRSQNPCIQLAPAPQTPSGDSRHKGKPLGRRAGRLSSLSGKSWSTFSPRPF